MRITFLTTATLACASITTANAASIVTLQDLPKACLPSRMTNTPTYTTGMPHDYCHCPPLSYCSDPGKAMPKSIRDQCCPVPAPPPCISPAPSCPNTPIPPSNYGCSDCSPPFPDPLCPAYLVAFCSPPPPCTPQPPVCVQQPPVCSTPPPSPTCTSDYVTANCPTASGFALLLCLSSAASYCSTPPPPVCTTPPPVCTTPPPVCPPPPTTCPIPIPIPENDTSNNAQCDITHFRHSSSNCGEFTKIGPRTALFCTKFHINVDSCDAQADITNLNNALLACESALQLNPTYNAGKTTFNNLVDNYANKDKGILTNLLQGGISEVEAYLNCRQSAFSTYYPALYTEADIDQWINYPRSNGPSGGVPQTFPPANALFVSAESSAPDLRGSVLINRNFIGKYIDSTYAGGSAYSYNITVDIGDVENSVSDVTNYANYQKHTKEMFRLLHLNGFGWANLNTYNFQTARPASSADLTNGINYISCLKKSSINICLFSETATADCTTCLAPDTKITLADETQQLISTLKSGDKVKNINGDDGIIEKVIETQWPELKLYNINNGRLKLTADHPVMTKNGWRAINYNMRKDKSTPHRYGIAFKDVKPLKIGDIIITENGTITVEYIMPEATIKNGVTYNLKVKNTDGFYANGIWVKDQH